MTIMEKWDHYMLAVSFHCYAVRESRAKIDFRREQLHSAADAPGKTCLDGVEGGPRYTPTTRDHK